MGTTAAPKVKTFWSSAAQQPHPGGHFAHETYQPVSHGGSSYSCLPSLVSDLYTCGLHSNVNCDLRCSADTHQHTLSAATQPGTPQPVQAACWNGQRFEFSTRARTSGSRYN